MKKLLIAIVLLCLSALAHAQTPCSLPCLITGTDGPQGPAGPPGAPGPAGPQGPAGSGGGAVMVPGGRLTLVAGQPTMSADVTSSTLWYAPYNTDTFPIFDGAAWQAVHFTSSATDQIGASMAGGAKWTAGSSRDVFGTITGAMCTGPAWPAADPASRSLTRYNGILVNSAALTCDTAASLSVTCPQYQCTYLGSIHPSVAGQLTAQFTYGQNRIFETWTAYNWNQIDITLHVGFVIPTTVPTNQYPNWQPFNNDPLNRANVFTGLPTAVDVAYHQNTFVNSQSGPSGVIALVGWDGVDLGFHVSASSDTATMASTLGGVARYINSSAVGLHTATMMVAKANAATSTVFGGTTIGPPNNYTSKEGNSVLFACFKG